MDLNNMKFIKDAKELLRSMVGPLNHWENCIPASRILKCIQLKPVYNGIRIHESDHLFVHVPELLEHFLVYTTENLEMEYV